MFFFFLGQIVYNTLCDELFRFINTSMLNKTHISTFFLERITCRVQSYPGVSKVTPKGGVTLDGHIFKFLTQKILMIHKYWYYAYVVLIKVYNMVPINSVAVRDSCLDNNAVNPISRELTLWRCGLECFPSGHE